MPSKHEWESSHAVSQLQAVFDSPVLLHVKTKILVHGRARKGDPPCPCCGSKLARIIEERDDLELLVDRVTGHRRLRSQVKDKAGFDQLAQVAKSVEIPLRCYRSQLKLLLCDDKKIVQALAGNRAGKTTAGAYWLVRMWMLRGGRGATFWWVSPQRSQTQIGVSKLVTGEFADRKSPPAFPLGEDGRPLLVASWPETERTSSQRIVMVDGSVIVLHHASRPTGGNLKGHNVQAILCDETCEIKHRPNWTVMIARLMESGGSLYSSTTPRPGHWLKEVVVDASKANKDILVVSLSSRDNPWISKTEIERTIRASHDEGEVAREVDGQWVSDQGNLYIHFDARRHTVDDHTYNCLKDQTDVTAQATRSWWKGPNPYVRSLRTHEPKFVGGLDVNCNPMTCIVAKVFGTPGKPETWSIYVLDEVQKYRTETWQFGQHLRSDQVRRGAVSFANIPIAIDPTACSWDPTMTRVSAVKYGQNAAKTMADLGFDARPANLSVRGYACGVSKHLTTGLLQKLTREGRIIINATRCPALMRAFTEQQNDGKGVAVKVSNTSSDKLSSPIDALAYLAWALFQDEETGSSPAKIEVL